MSFKNVSRTGMCYFSRVINEIDTCLNGVKELSFEISGLEYLSSAGLRTLLSAQKTMNGQGTMKVLHPKDSVMEIFEITGFTDILTIIK